MKKHHLPKLFLTVIFISLWSCQETKIESGTEYSNTIKEIIETKNSKLQTWYAQGMIDSVAAHFADDCIQMPPHQPPIMGVENFKKVWKENTQMGTWNFDLKTNDVKASGDLAVEYGSYILTFSPNQKSLIPAMDDKGNYVAVWERINDDWKIVWDAPTPTTPMELPPAMDSIPK
ncbi:nuclear transport factor 2 family protein [Gaetbulibacter sp. M240]|uniref:YybH family protein n=1 Tax=Gaetbulibacter sp. M240 TaxID=3126511 RepID=UPI00374FB779